MYLLTSNYKRVQLVPLQTEVVEDVATKSMTVAVNANPNRDPSNASSLVARASRVFFDIGVTSDGGEIAARASETVPLQGPPPVAFREKDSGLIRVVYREIVVRFKDGVKNKRRDDILKDYDLKIRRTNPFVEKQFILYQPDRRYSGDELLEISNKLTELEEVVFASPNFVSQFLREQLPSIPKAAWHLKNTGINGAKTGEDVNISAAWKLTRGKKSVIVAVLDDGVDIEHPALKARIWKNPDTQSADKFGRDFYIPETNVEHFNPRPKKFQFPYDQMRGNDIHGTCCAGVVAASGLTKGSIGAAPKCTILPVKIFHADDLASEEQVANSMRYSATIADILSCSWGGVVSEDIKLALEDIAQTGRNGLGAPVFCAAGNNFGSPISYPAKYPDAIAVGASTDLAGRSNYSNVGPELQFVAPSSGGKNGIYTTDVSYPQRGFNLGETSDPNGLYTNGFGGTSSATPLAAGVAALMLSVNPKLTAVEIRDILSQTADKIGSGYDANGFSNEFGFGRINAGKAVKAAKDKL